MTEPTPISLSATDLHQIEEHGLTEAEARRQLALLQSPPPPVRLARPATPGDGILSLAKGSRLMLEVGWADLSSSGRITKMTPASGAASRMFHALEEARESGQVDTEEIADFLGDLPRFAFYEDLAAALAESGEDLDDLARRDQSEPILEHLLTDVGTDSEPGRGLRYATLPKGLVPFHRYPGERRTAFEEHLVEAVGTVRDEEGVCRLHFTVAPEHQEAFEERLEAVRDKYEKRYECSFEVTFSHQEPGTDTLALTADGQPLRDHLTRLVFRPGGHGALLANLEQLDADVVVIKNIDNVVPEKRQELVLEWKRLLLGKMRELKDTVHGTLSLLESTGGDNEEILGDAAEMAEMLGHPMPPMVAEASVARRRAWLIDRLDRPLRLAGVVPNEGEPGGGPFWVRDADGGESLQIVESSQIDHDDPDQAEIAAEATHFNPVDLVCSLTDGVGMPYELAQYVDANAAFVAEKPHQGRPIRALEHPGLWNGAMAGWNTVFVEVPLATFAPVKTVTDLLRDTHQTGVPPERG